MSTEAQAQSWRQTKGELGERQRIVLEKIQNNPKGLSAWQTAALLNLPVYVVRPRITELHKKGLLQERGERWNAGTQRTEAVWMFCESDQLNLL